MRSKKIINLQRRFKYKCNECGTVCPSREKIRFHVKRVHKIKGSKGKLKKRLTEGENLPIASYYYAIEIKDE